MKSDRFISYIYSPEDPPVTLGMTPDASVYMHDTCYARVYPSDFTVFVRPHSCAGALTPNHWRGRSFAFSSMPIPHHVPASG